MVTLLLKKSYLHKDLKEVKFNDLWNGYGIFTTMRVIGRSAKILFYKTHIDNLIKSLNKYNIRKKNLRKNILKLIKLNLKKNKNYDHLLRVALNNKIISISLRKRPIPKSNFKLKLVNYKRVDAAYKLTTANLMLVVKIAMTFKREWQNIMDLVQEGNVGLMKAVKNFDPFRGVRLSAYATWWIKSYILKYILDNWRLVRVGTTNARRKLLFNLKKEKERLEREGFDPSTKLLSLIHI